MAAPSGTFLRPTTALFLCKCDPARSRRWHGGCKMAAGSTFVEAKTMTARSPFPTAWMSAAGRKARRVAAWLRRLLTETGYRPEAHYMRGPGPKSRAAAR